jgi:hypothetical protein
VSGPSAYAVGFIEGRSVSDRHVRSGFWFEIPVPQDVPFDLAWVSPSDTDSVAVSKARFFTSPTPIDLSELNREDFPPSDPRFSHVPSIPNGTVIPPGGSVPVSAVAPVPEPGTIVLSGLGALSLLGYAWRRRKRGG